MNAPIAYYPDVRAGVEWRYRDRVAIRTGYRAELGGEGGDALTGPTFGLGAGVAGMWLDYGFVTSGVTGESQHRIGLTLHPGRFGMGGVHGPQAEARSVTQRESK